MNRIKLFLSRLVDFLFTGVHAYCMKVNALCSPVTDWMFGYSFIETKTPSFKDVCAFILGAWMFVLGICVFASSIVLVQMAIEFVLALIVPVELASFLAMVIVTVSIRLFIYRNTRSSYSIYLRRHA